MLNSVVTNSQLLVYILAQTLSMIAMMGVITKTKCPKLDAVKCP
jgi:hypothetical protein